jgi:hypothetical protein
LKRRRRGTTGAARRALLGFFAASLSVLSFQAGMWWVLFRLGRMPPPYPTVPTAPFGVPEIASLVVWGGLYGVLYALLRPNLRGPSVVWGLLLGVFACLVDWLVVGPLKGRPLFDAPPEIALPLNLAWGIGMAAFGGLLLPRRRAA